MWCAVFPEEHPVSQQSVPYYGIDLHVTVYASEELLCGTDVREQMKSYCRANEILVQVRAEEAPLVHPVLE